MKEKMKAKIAELNDAKAQLIAQVNAINGAIQVLEEMLKEQPENKEG